MDNVKTLASAQAGDLIKHKNKLYRVIDADMEFINWTKQIRCVLAGTNKRVLRVKTFNV
jgi:hypothetical protein